MQCQVSRNRSFHATESEWRRMEAENRRGVFRGWVRTFYLIYPA